MNLPGGEDKFGKENCDTLLSEGSGQFLLQHTL